MAQYRRNLPQLTGGLFLTDGGIETTLIFHEGHELPLFAAFDLLKRLSQDSNTPLHEVAERLTSSGRHSAGESSR